VAAVDRYATVDPPAKRSGPSDRDPAALVLSTHGRRRPVAQDGVQRRAAG
jgi:hypothetical protein